MVDVLSAFEDILLYKAVTGDPTHGGKLIPTHIVDKNGHHKLVYKSQEEIKKLKEEGEHDHVSELSPGHRIIDKKLGEGKIHKIKGHDGKGYEMVVDFDGKRTTRYVHNVTAVKPDENDQKSVKEKLQPAANKQPKSQATVRKENTKVNTNQEEPIDDDGDEDFLDSAERMKEWEQIVYKVVTPGKGVNAGLAYGTGGVGKTYRLKKMLDGLNMKEGDDYVSFTGGTTSAGLYEILYENNGKTIIFDDFDDVFKDKEAINMLKGAVDTSKVRVVTRATAKSTEADLDDDGGDVDDEGGDDGNLPPRFRFTGKVLFISNLNLDHVANSGKGNAKDIEAILSRADSINLRMSKEQTLDLIEKDILFKPNFHFKKADGSAAPSTAEDKKEIFGFVKENVDDFSELSVRTLGKLNAIRSFYDKKGGDWKKIANSMLLEGKSEEMGVNERFDAYGDFAEIVANGGVKSAIAYGRGGIGKTYTALERLNDAGMHSYDDLVDSGELNNVPEEKQYVHIQGGSLTPKALYNTLYKHRGRMIIIDDADSVLLDSKAQNILKGALDTSGSGQINYKTSSNVKVPSKVPDQFEFKGRVMFISNLPKEKISQPLQSRALTVNTQMTRDESIERMRFVADKKTKTGKYVSDNVHGASKKDVDDVLDYFQSLSDRIPDRHFNNRTIDKLVADKIDAEERGADWKKIVKTKLLKGQENELSISFMEILNY